MKKTMYYVILMFLVSSFLFPVLAQSPTNADEIQKIRQAIQEKVTEKLQELRNSQTTVPLDNKTAIIGTVIQTSTSQISLDYRNSTINVSVSSDTIFIDQNRNKTKFSNLKIGQDVLVLGLIGNEKTIDAKRIVFSDLKTIENKNLTLVGKIVDISKSSPIFVLIPSNNKDTQYQLKTDTKSILINSSDKTITSKELAAGQKIIVIVRPDPKTAKTYLVHKLINFGPFPEKTPSPTPKK